MKKIKIPLLIFISAFGFSLSSYAADNELPAEMIIYSSLGLQLKQIMTIPEHEEVTTSTPVVLAPTGTTAAIYDATGSATRTVQASVTTSTIELACQTTASCGTAKIPVTDFTFGGGLSSSGAATFDAAGKITNMRVGATATIDANDKTGRYYGVGTFRLVYT